jgi:hypothetical protein
MLTSLPMKCLNEEAMQTHVRSDGASVNLIQIMRVRAVERSSVTR